MKKIFLGLVLLLLVGCATQQTRFGKGTNFRDDAYLRSGAQNIQILSYIPSKAEILGSVKTERCNNDLLKENATFDDFVNDLKVEAFILGANYIYDVRYVKAPVVGGLLRNCWSHVSAYAIAYKVHDLSKNEDKKPKEDSVKSSDEPKIITGTAFFINNQGTLITNEHVVKSCREPYVIFKNKNYSAEIVSVDKKLDLALIKTNIDNKNYLKIYNNEIKQLQKVVAAGYPLTGILGMDLKFTSGIVSSLRGLGDSNLIQIDAALNHGNSGGPIVDEKNGSLVAVAVAGLPSAQGVNFGIKNTALLSFINANKVRSDSSASYSLGGYDILKNLEESTLLLFCEFKT
jgi:S1-C subfamily serine protease